MACYHNSVTKATISTVYNLLFIKKHLTKLKKYAIICATM